VRVFNEDYVTEWSSPFSLDAAGTNGIFSTKNKDFDFQVGRSSIKWTILILFFFFLEFFLDSGRLL